MTAVGCSKVASLVLTVVCTKSVSEVTTNRLAHVTTLARGLPVKIVYRQNWPVYKADRQRRFKSFLKEMGHVTNKIGYCNWTRRNRKHFYSKTNQIHNISNLFYFGITLYMFRTIFPSIIRSLR
jgi:hypothetical protein